MVGPILVFLGVCALVAIYMYIVHSFLAASEENVDETPTLMESPPEEHIHPQPPPQQTRHRWAH